MKISIITVTFNSSKYLEDCIKSVIQQNHKDIEHIIIDGLSTDDTVSIIKKYEDHLAFWVSEKDNGMYDAINKGLQFATGDIVGMLHSDDVLATPDVIAAIAASFKSNNVDSLYGDLVYVDPNNMDKVLRVWKGYDYKRSKFRYGWMPAHPTFYIKKEVVDKLGGYETHYYTASDYEFMARYLYRHKVSCIYLPKLIVRMRNGGASNSSLYSRLRANRRDYLAMKNNKIPFPLVGSLLKPIRKLPQFSTNFIHNFFGKKNTKKAAAPFTSLVPAE